LDFDFLEKGKNLFGFLDIREELFTNKERGNIFGILNDLKGKRKSFWLFQLRYQNVFGFLEFLEMEGKMFLEFCFSNFFVLFEYKRNFPTT